jgi:hypothetical protein
VNRHERQKRKHPRERGSTGREDNANPQVIPCQLWHKKLDEYFEVLSARLTYSPCSIPLSSVLHSILAHGGAMGIDPNSSSLDILKPTPSSTPAVYDFRDARAETTLGFAKLAQPTCSAAFSQNIPSSTASISESYL